MSQKWDARLIRVKGVGFIISLLSKVTFYGIGEKRRIFLSCITEEQIRWVFDDKGKFSKIFHTNHMLWVLIRIASPSIEYPNYPQIPTLSFSLHDRVFETHNATIQNAGLAIVPFSLSTLVLSIVPASSVFAVYCIVVDDSLDDEP